MGKDAKEEKELLKSEMAWNEEMKSFEMKKIVFWKIIWKINSKKL